MNLERAMENADIAELEATADEIGRQAVQAALAHRLPAPKPAAAVVPNPEEDRQRDLDAALADAVEIVARHRARLGRKVCSRHDGQTVRQVFELLRGMIGDTLDRDPSFT